MTVKFEVFRFEHDGRNRNSLMISGRWNGDLGVLPVRRCDNMSTSSAVWPDWHNYNVIL